MRVRHLKSLSRDDLSLFVAENLPYLTEDEALAILDHPHVSAKLLGALAQNQRLGAAGALLMLSAR